MALLEKHENEFVSTPRHLKSLDEDLVVFAPDARRTSKIWDDLEFPGKDEAIFVEMPKSVFLDSSDTLIEAKSSNAMPIINVPRLSIGNRLLLTPEHKHSKLDSEKRKFRESILSTGVPKNDNISCGIEIGYENLTTNDNDSDAESLFELNTHSLDDQGQFSYSRNGRQLKINGNDFLFLEVNQDSKQNEDNIFTDVDISPIFSFGKRQRSSPSIHSESDSPFELIHIMKKSLKLS